MTNFAGTDLSSSNFSGTFVSSLRQTIGKNLLPPLSIAAAVSTVLVGTSAWKTWSVHQDFKSAVSRNFELQQLSDKVVYLDEVLTMSARMGASTGDTSWETRYKNFVPQLDTTLDSLLELAPEHQKGTSQTDEANLRLIEMEEKAFELVQKGESKTALSLLLGSDYETQKQIYGEGIDATLTSIQGAVDSQIESYSAELFRSALLATLSFPLMLVSWTIVLMLVRNYIREQTEAQTAVLQMNLELEERVASRTQQLSEQEKAAREESEGLQSDIGQILGVVSAVEEGDLTVEAPVSDRVTGLVSDTLNRLIEELGSVLGQVWQASEKVSTGAQQLEGMAATVAENTTQQAHSVKQVLSLTERVEQSAKNSVSQIQETMERLKRLSLSAEQGEVTMSELDKGIETLQQGTEQIVQQMKTLGEFVGLTDQFLQEQSQIAGMTQVLAMNASLVAARGSEQRDPSQFVVVAREFEAIANQVSSLAQRTSSGLSTLEQQSGQIHSVVSSVDANVQELGGLVRDFNQGVEKSRAAFGTVSQATQDSVQAGESLQATNAKIDEAAQSTAALMREIADFSQQTAQLTQRSRAESDQMGALSSQLLKTIQFFQLPHLKTAVAIATHQQQSEQASLPPAAPVANNPSMASFTAVTAEPAQDTGDESGQTQGADHSVSLTP